MPEDSMPCESDKEQWEDRNGAGELGGLWQLVSLMADWTRSLCVLPLLGILYLKMRDKEALKKEADQIALTVKTMLWLCNLGGVEYCT